MREISREDVELVQSLTNNDLVISGYRQSEVLCILLREVLELKKLVEELAPERDDGT